MICCSQYKMIPKVVISRVIPHMWFGVEIVNIYQSTYLITLGYHIKWPRAP